MNVEQYLQRLNYQGEIPPSLQNLCDLHRTHAYTIPFENYDVHLKIPIIIEEERLFEKLIVQQRGGYCYELNTLFSLLLKELNYSFKYLVARSLYGKDYLPPRTHMLLLMEIDSQQYLADLGFGGVGLLEPLKLEVGKEVKQYYDTFRLLEDKKLGFILEVKDEEADGGWISLYSFDLHEQLLVDYELPNYFNSTSPKSIFTKQIVCAMPSSEGRVRLVNESLKIRTQSLRQDHQISSSGEYLSLLQKHFGVVLPLNTRFSILSTGQTLFED